MIIQCESCSKKFQVKDTDIPQEGRMVQCSNCSQKWFQAPIKTQSSITPDTDKKVSKMEFEASDGRVYRFMGSQWAEVLRSGKTGLLAKRTIGAELNRLAGITKPKKSRKREKKNAEMEIENISKIIDPSSEQIDSIIPKLLDKLMLDFLAYRPLELKKGSHLVVNLYFLFFSKISIHLV